MAGGFAVAVCSWRASPTRCTCPMAILGWARARRPCCQLFQSPAHRPADSRQPAPAPAHVSRPAAVLSRPCHIDQIQTVYNVGVVASPVAGCVPHHRCRGLGVQNIWAGRRFFVSNSVSVSLSSTHVAISNTLWRTSFCSLPSSCLSSRCVCNKQSNAPSGTVITHYEPPCET